MMQNYVGKLLISHPNVPPDNIFSRTVIYIYQHDERAGTVGVIINKRSRYPITEVAGEKGINFADTSKFVYHGGPVNQQALVLLHTDDWNSSNTAVAGKSLCVSSDNHMLEKIGVGNEPAYWRLFGGMCGWAPGQLNAELSGEWPYRPENSWLIADAIEDIVFSLDGDKQWQKCFQLSSDQLFKQYL